ncbi:MAG: hypothetical protein WCP36_01420 [Methanomicrobiales archaeon]
MPTPDRKQRIGKLTGNMRDILKFSNDSMQEYKIDHNDPSDSPDSYMEYYEDIDEEEDVVVDYEEDCGDDFD